MNTKHLSPDDAIYHLVNNLRRITEHEISSVEQYIYGRVLAEPISADRDSPAADISAMDGFAINIHDVNTESMIEVRGESKAGSPPPELEKGTAVRIFTGAMLPATANAVIKREDTTVIEQAIRIKASEGGYPEGLNIRKAGENAPRGSEILSRGTLLNSANASTLASFGCDAVSLIRPLQISVITTGDEVGQFGRAAPKPWQIRNSNALSLKVLFDAHPWIKITHTGHCSDEEGSLLAVMTQSLEKADALIITGGVSVGDYDFVPSVIQKMGANVAFHGLPIRPGKPVLGASTEQGKLILGLPGNPVSAITGCQRLGIPLLKYIAGFSSWNQRPPKVLLKNADTKTIPLHWLRLVEESFDGSVTLCQNQGSGDLVALGKSSGFIEIDPNQNSEGRWPYYRWQ